MLCGCPERVSIESIRGRTESNNRRRGSELLNMIMLAVLSARPYGVMTVGSDTRHRDRRVCCTVSLVYFSNCPSISIIALLGSGG